MSHPVCLEIVCIGIWSRKAWRQSQKAQVFLFGPDASGGTQVSVVTLEFSWTRIEAASNIQELSKTLFAAGHPAERCRQWHACPKTQPGRDGVVSPGGSERRGDLGLGSLGDSCVMCVAGQGSISSRPSNLAGSLDPPPMKSLIPLLGCFVSTPGPITALVARPSSVNLPSSCYISQRPCRWSQSAHSKPSI